MNIKISVPKAIEIFKDIYEQPERLFEMICFDIRETVPKITLQLPNPLAGVIDKSLLSPGRLPIHNSNSFDHTLCTVPG